jgi:hypothetical protein
MLAFDRVDPRVRPMGTVLAKVVGGLVFVLAAMAGVFVVRMRRRSPAVIGAVRRLSRATKRFPLKSAGRSRAYASVVRHVGRTSCREYQTPVHAVATADGFAVALPYGPDSDCVKNVRARGTAVMTIRCSCRWRWLRTTSHPGTGEFIACSA